MERRHGQMFSSLTRLPVRWLSTSSINRSAEV